MSFVLQPWQLLLLILSGWINREQQRIIEYQRTEIQVLKELFGSKRILLNDNQRRRLGIKGKLLGRKLLAKGPSWIESLLSENPKTRLVTDCIPNNGTARSSEQISERNE